MVRSNLSVQAYGTYIHEETHRIKRAECRQDEWPALLQRDPVAIWQLVWSGGEIAHRYVQMISRSPCQGGRPEPSHQCYLSWNTLKKPTQVHQNMTSVHTYASLTLLHWLLPSVVSWGNFAPHTAAAPILCFAPTTHYTSRPKPVAGSVAVWLFLLLVTPDSTAQFGRNG